MDDGDHPQGNVVHRQLVVAGTQGAALLEPAHYPLDDVPLAVAGLVECLVARLALARGNNVLDMMPLQPGTHARVAVALVRRHAGWPALLPRLPRPARPPHHRLEALRLMPLPRGHE